MRSGDSTSRSLLVRAGANDQEAWQRLVSLYSPLVGYWCRARGVHPDDLADVSQEIFAAAATGLKNYRHDLPGSTFRGWLRGIASHKLQDYHRRPSARGEGGSTALVRMQQVPADGEGSVHSEGDGEVASLYRRALEQVRSQFEERTWQAFWKVAMEDKTPADVAAELGLSVTSVRQAKSRVLRRLKEELGELIA
jgi:RNA polymerase sigma-70 factor (ECF subfamily)